MELADHPAKFSKNIIEKICWLVDNRFLLADLDEANPPPWHIIDPFAGTGKVHDIDRLINGRHWYYTVGVEIEPEWAAHHPRTIVGNALCLPFPDNWFHAGVTSSTYGNRVADSHTAKDLCGLCHGVKYGIDGLLCKRCKGTGLSVRKTYRHMLGRPLHSDNSGQMHWNNGPSGNPYRVFHETAWRELHRVLKPGAPFVFNCSNHVRGGKMQRVTAWHLETLLQIGFDLLTCEQIQTPRMKYGVNYESRAKYETIAVLEKAA